MITYVPMISSGVAGPLGALHLPRLWMTEMLAATGQLADGYTTLESLKGGYAQMTCAALGLDPAAVVAFIKDNKPTYPQFEAWVRKNGKKLTPADIKRHNLAILGYCHDDDTRKGIASAAGVPDDGNMPPDAVGANDEDDRTEFYNAVFRENASPAEMPPVEATVPSNPNGGGDDGAEATPAAVSGGDKPAEEPVAQS